MGGSSSGKANKDTLLESDPGFEQFVNRHASFLLNAEAKLDVPPALIGLLPSTVRPIKAVFSDNKTPWLNSNIRKNSNQRSKNPSPPVQGVGADSAFPSFTDTQATQDDNDFQRFLKNPLLIERPFNQLQRTTRPPNFTPIPIPEVLRPSKINRLPSGLESALSATTVKPLMVPFEAKYGLQPPSQLANWFKEKFQPTNDHVQTVKSAFQSNSQVKVPTALDLYGNFGHSPKISPEEPEKKIIALEARPSLGNSLFI